MISLLYKIYPRFIYLKSVAFLVIIAVTTIVIEIQEIEYIFQHIHGGRGNDYLRDVHVVGHPIEHIQRSSHAQQVRILAPINVKNIYKNFNKNRIDKNLLISFAY